MYFSRGKNSVKKFKFAYKKNNVKKRTLFSCRKKCVGRIYFPPN